jgi:hypothetical protein
MKRTDNIDIATKIWDELKAKSFTWYLTWGEYFKRPDVIKFEVLCKEFHPQSSDRDFMCCSPKNYPEVSGFCFETFKGDE